MSEHDPDLLEQIRIERQALVADMQRRREQLDRDETLATARKQTTSSRDEVSPPIDRGRQHRAAPAPSDMVQQGWVNYIRQQLDARDRAILRGVATVVIEEERARQAAERRIATLETELAELRERLNIEQRSRGPRSVPPSTGAMIA